MTKVYKYDFMISSTEICLNSKSINHVVYFITFPQTMFSIKFSGASNFFWAAGNG